MLHLVCKQADSGPQAVCEAIGRVGKLLGDDWVLRTVGPWESNPQPSGQKPAPRVLPTRRKTLKTIRDLGFHLSSSPLDSQPLLSTDGG